jgi:acetoacetyl-CoA synthase
MTRDQTAIGVLGTGSYVPERVMDNAELARIVGTTAGWILERTGVLERRVAAADQATSDLAIAAGERALAASGVDRCEIDLVLLATSTPDQPLPATACTVQAALGLTNASALDVDAVCTGFVYATQVARSMLLTDPTLRHALVIGADTYSRILDYSDRRTACLFGDGAGAAVMGPVRAGTGISYARLGADGTKRDYVEIFGGGSREPASAATVANGRHYFRMRGRAVREFVDECFPQIIKETLDGAGLQLPDIDLIVPHQANMRLLASCAEACGVPATQLYLCGDRFGNTGAASVPLALDTAVAEGRVRPGDEVLLVAFGGGMTWGGILIHWEDS